VSGDPISLPPTPQPGAGRAVVLLSGGLDSAVAFGLWLQQGGTVALALTADYRQRAAGRELAVAQALAARFGAPWQSVDLGFLADPARRADCALLPGGRELPSTTPVRPGDDASAAAVWVPARNVILLGVAAAYAEALAADVVVAGFNCEEAATFADNSARFVAAFSRALELGCRRPVRVASPTIELDKSAIVAHARALGLGPADVWSCYAGGAAPCRRCESCVRGARAWG
jgi:7-cyano-7-deazaguanine synthase